MLRSFHLEIESIGNIIIMGDLLAKSTMNIALEKWIKDVSANGIFQHSPEWYDARKLGVGGSSISVIEGTNPYSNLISMLESLLDLTPFEGSIATDWGTLFEEVAKLYVEKDLICKIDGTDIFYGGAPGTYYSPDGLTVLPHDGDYHIHLMEFKCPFSRLPAEAQPPEYYVSQVKYGLCVLNLPTRGMLAEIVIRRCGWEHMGLSRVFDKQFKQQRIPAGAPVAFGAIYLHINPAIAESLSWRAAYEDYFGNALVPESRDFNDLGDAPPELFEQILNSMSKKDVLVTYGKIYTAEADVAECCNAESAAIIDQIHGAGAILVGVIPWKIFGAHYHKIEKDPGYLSALYPQLADIHEFLKSARDDTPANKRIKLAEFVKDKNVKPIKFNFAAKKRTAASTAQASQSK